MHVCVCQGQVCSIFWWIYLDIWKRLFFFFFNISEPWKFSLFVMLDRKDMFCSLIGRSEVRVWYRNLLQELEEIKWENLIYRHMSSRVRFALLALCHLKVEIKWRDQNLHMNVYILVQLRHDTSVVSTETVNEVARSSVLMVCSLWYCLLLHVYRCTVQCNHFYILLLIVVLLILIYLICNSVIKKD